MTQTPLTNDAPEAQQGTNIIPTSIAPPAPPATPSDGPSEGSSQGQGEGAEQSGEDDDDADDDSGEDDGDDDGGGEGDESIANFHTSSLLALMCLREEEEEEASGSHYVAGGKYCSTCECYFFTQQLSCGCCGLRLRANPHRGRDKKKPIAVV